jgi:hypothetical protein
VPGQVQPPGDDFAAQPLPVRFEDLGCQGGSRASQILVLTASAAELIFERTNHLQKRSPLQPLFLEPTAPGRSLDFEVDDLRPRLDLGRRWGGIERAAGGVGRQGRGDFVVLLEQVVA